MTITVGNLSVNWGSNEASAYASSDAGGNINIQNLKVPPNADKRQVLTAISDMLQAISEEINAEITRLPAQPSGPGFRPGFTG